MRLAKDIIMKLYNRCKLNQSLVNNSEKMFFQSKLWVCTDREIASGEKRFRQDTILELVHRRRPTDAGPHAVGVRRRLHS